MPVPNARIKINRNGVRYVSSVDKVQFTLKQLIRAALKDVAKAMLYKMKMEIRKSPSIKKYVKGKRSKALFQYWIPSKTGELIIGTKANTWYGVDAELGTKKQPKRGVMKSTVLANIDLIRKIQGKYLSYINDENLALGLIDENEHSSTNDSEITVDTWG